MKTLKGLALMAVVLSTTIASAQEYGGGGALRPASEDVGSAIYLTNQAIGEVFQRDHALRRDRSATFWQKISKFVAEGSEVYDSANSWTGQNCVTPVRSQGATNMCWDFAATAALEASYCMNLGRTIDASEQTVLECFEGPAASTGRENTPGSETKAYDVMRGRGVEREFLNPFNPRKVKDCGKHVPFQEYYGVEGVVSIPDQVVTGLPSIGAIKRAIVDNGAVTLTVYNTTLFKGYTAGDLPLVNTAAQVAIAKKNDSMHEVVIVGWDDTRGAWRLKNSWSPRWGDAGFSWIVYNDLSMLSGYFTHVTPVVKRGAPDLAMLRFEMFEALSRIPSIWVENPQVQFPASLGFPPHKQTLSEAMRFALDLSPAAPLTWLENVRTRPF